MKSARIALILLVAVLMFGLSRSTPAAPAPNSPATRPSEPQLQFAEVVRRVIDLIEPPANSVPRTLSMRVVLTEAAGLPKELAGQELQVAYQAPDRLKLSLQFDGQQYAGARNGNEIWFHDISRKFILFGATGRAMFNAEPAELDRTKLPAFSLPIGRAQLAMLMLSVAVEGAGSEAVDGTACDVLKVAPLPAARALGFNSGELRLWVRRTDGLPVRVVYTDGGVRVRIDLRDLAVTEPWPADKWNYPSGDGARVERIALGHVERFLRVLPTYFSNSIPTLGPATGQKRLVATAGKGRLEDHDGTRVLFLQGSPAEMGQQQGTLLREQVRDTAERMLWGVGVASSLAKGSWFFGEIESAQKRTQPFVSADVLAEIDALSDAVGIPRAEGRLANYFPELFHCSGFAVFGEATVGGTLYHGRVLDYLKGVGLEQSAVVTVRRQDGKNAWVNVGYAGFVGSVTAMNEKHIAMGEMGGGGQGDWDGTPMAQLVRKVMEEASTLDEAVSIMRIARRTCEYYYVISDGNTRRAVGIHATPTVFEAVGPGESHPQLPHAVKDAVLLSAGQRYETLVARVKANYGKLDADGARHLMDLPVCMPSNIHSALFAPETLDLWVANADSRNVASHTRYTHYNLGELLKAAPAEKVRLEDTFLKK
jgi:hypothetical protein